MIKFISLVFVNLVAVSFISAALAVDEPGSSAANSPVSTKNTMAKKSSTKLRDRNKAARKNKGTPAVIDTPLAESSASSTPPPAAAPAKIKKNNLSERNLKAKENTTK